jgi:hypothetical protein
MTSTPTPIKAASFTDYLSDAGDLAEDAFAGVLVMYSFRGAKTANVTRAQMDIGFTRYGLNPHYLPSEPTQAQAFKNATGDKAAQWKYSVAGKTMFAEVKAVGSDRDTVTRVVWAYEIVTVNGTPRNLNGREVGKITFYKARPGGSAVERWELYEAELMPGERDQLDPFIASLREEYRWYSTYLYDQPIRQSVMRYIETGLNGISTLTSGGCYFVHRSRWDELRNLASMVRELSPDFTLTLCPIPNLPDIRESLIEAFQNEAEKAVTSLVVKMQERRKGGRITATMVQGFGADVQQIAARAEEHSRIFDVGQDRTANALEIAYTALAGLANQIGAED